MIELSFGQKTVHAEKFHVFRAFFHPRPNERQRITILAAEIPAPKPGNNLLPQKTDMRYTTDRSALRQHRRLCHVNQAGGQFALAIEND